MAERPPHVLAAFGRVVHDPHPRRLEVVEDGNVARRVEEHPDPGGHPAGPRVQRHHVEHRRVALFLRELQGAVADRDDEPWVLLARQAGDVRLGVVGKDYIPQAAVELALESVDRLVVPLLVKRLEHEDVVGEGRDGREEHDGQHDEESQNLHLTPASPQRPAFW